MTGCTDSTAPAPPVIARVAVTAPNTVLGTGDSVRAIATAYDSSGSVVHGAQFSWNVGDATLATVDATGMVHALRAGSVQVTATAVGPAESVKTTVSGAFTFELRQIATRLRITVPDTVLTGDTIPLTAKVYDALDIEIPQPTISWSTSDSSAAIVTASGVLIGRAIGGSVITARPAESGTTVQTSSSVVVRVRFAQIAGGAYHNCGVARGGVVHCWGEGAWGRLGTGVSYPAWKSVTAPAPILVPARFTAVDADEQHDSRSGHSCARSIEGVAYCWGSGSWGMLADGKHGEDIPPYVNPFPTALTGVTSVRQIGTGAQHTCVLDDAGAAYCAGGNGFDQIGTSEPLGTCTDATCATHLTSVQGGHQFASLAVGGYHTCGLTTSGDAWCWGYNSAGELGAGSSAATSAIPLHAAGVQLASLAAGESHTCGLDAGGTAYCWGNGWFGQLGNGLFGFAGAKGTPTRLTTLQTFASIYAGIYHTCALTTDGVAYCWGDNKTGQLGFTTTEMCGESLANSVIDPCATTPQPVNTSLRFVSLALGWDHTCGLTQEGEVYCWGANDRGQLGDGTTTSRTAPTRVVDVK